MNQSALLAVGGLIVGALLAAVYYASRPIPVPLTPIPCALPTNYCINVYVVPTPDNPSVPLIRVSSTDVYVQEPRGTKVNIWWIMQNSSGQNYKFPANSVVFAGKPPTPVSPPLHQFEPCRVADQADPPNPPTIAYLCVDSNTVRGDFGYTLTLNSNPPIPLDPWIHNQ
jgi:hypothetical protein